MEQKYQKQAVKNQLKTFGIEGFGVTQNRSRKFSIK
jgi:hypothetical protein